MLKVQLLSHKKILVERLPNKMYVPNVPAMTVSFLLHNYQLNHLLIQRFSHQMVWVDLSRCDSDQRESSWNLCDSKLQNFCAQLFQLKKYFRAQHFRNFCYLQCFHFHFSLRHSTECPCRQYPTSILWSQTCQISPAW